MNQIRIMCIFLVLSFLSCNTQYLVNNEYEVSTNSSELELHEEIPIPLDMVNEWELETLRTDINKNFMNIISNDKTLTLGISSDGRVSGYDGCNNYSSKIIFVDRNNFSFSSFLTTSRACHPSVYWHSKFYKTIGSVNNYTIQNGKLLLKKDSHVLMTFSKI
ncbi:META domain-containing protein [Dysgonomonas sp. Marseille-P4677]|uniref:META domain-containing protein n=1 Tax=Dysgonomonas sp. Marseille-P4677 TaxID=2364790 RepID=UPI00191396A4|nr:META domain-containing protein [Dysgonomonas sp. Marseille-P4677]MBK5721309.1 META domain-containing protein [Dysgonomonas sp. Marseille-P4677]